MSVLALHRGGDHAAELWDSLSELEWITLFYYPHNPFRHSGDCTGGRALRIRNRMSFIGQVCLHIQGICYSYRISTVQQTDSDRTGHRQQKNNIQIWNVQNGKNNIQYRQLCMSHDVQIWNEKISMWWINNCIIVLCVPRLMSSVHEMDCLGKETVSVSGRSGAQSSVVSTRW